jgi:formyltetrahydrofolate-dependent phosphoribosylglycinamide formyltransferase
MLKKLQERWHVNGWNLLLIIATFAIGGSLCGFLGRRLLLLTNLEKGVVWITLYLILITLLWPICVLLVSIPLGQFSFFKGYIQRVWNKVSGKRRNRRDERKLKIAIFASGAGTNAGKIIERFKKNAATRIALVVSNKPGAGVTQVAKDNNIELLLIDKNYLSKDAFVDELKKRKIDFIILAGFLLKLSPSLIQAYPKKIINLHPALLPAYGGQGMYGMRVHEAVIKNKEKQSGITIHFADELYDHGEIIFQSTCDISPTDTAETLSLKIQQLEHTHFPEVAEQVLQKQNQR